MGSFITIGCVCKGNVDKNQFIAILKRTLDINAEFLKNFKIKCPLKSDYKKWVINAFNYNEIDENLLICVNNKMAHISFDYINENNQVDVIIIEIEKIIGDSCGVLFSIPESAFGNKHIDDVETILCNELKQLIKLGYDYMFCDNEAHIEYLIEEVKTRKDLYSILMLSSGEVLRGSWKIDGLSKREN